MRYTILVFRNHDTQPTIHHAEDHNVAISRSHSAINSIPSIRMIIVKDEYGEFPDEIIDR